MSQPVTGNLGMRRVLGALTLAMAALLGAAPGVRAGQIYLLSTDFKNANGATALGTVDTTTGAYTQIAANVGAGNTVRNLAWNPTLGRFYTTENTDAGTTLRTLGTDGVMSSALGTIGKDIYGMAYQTGSDTLFAYDYNSDAYSTLDPTTGALTVLTAWPGLSASAAIGGRFAIHMGTLFAAVNNDDLGRFGTFGSTAGSIFTPVASDNDAYRQMVLASDGTTLYGLFADGPGSQTLYTIDPSTGALTAGPSLSGAGLGAYFQGAGIVPAAAVPEPATLASAALGGLVLLRIARRRRLADPTTA